MGVTNESGKFRARVYDHGKRYSLGMFDTKRKAQLAISRWKKAQEIPDNWGKQDADPNFLSTEIPKAAVNMSKPSLFKRLKAKLSVWQKKLHEL